MIKRKYLKCKRKSEKQKCAGLRYKIAATNCENVGELLNYEAVDWVFCQGGVESDRRGLLAQAADGVTP